MKIRIGIALSAGLLFLVSGCAGLKQPQTKDPLSTLPEFTLIDVHDREIKSTQLVNNHGLTVVSLFDQFCTECPTGERLETLNTLARQQRQDLAIAAVFAARNFTLQDVKNFSLMLKTTYALYHGNLDTFDEAMIKGRLLMVFNSRGKIVWQEKPGISEAEVLTTILRLAESERT